MSNYEVKVMPKFDLSEKDSVFIKNKELAYEFNRIVQKDGITYSKRKPYKKYEDIPSGTKFYFKLKNFKSIYYY